MNKLIINSANAVEEDIEEKIIDMMRPEFNFICSNPVRASILHLLVNSADVNHTMQVEYIAHRIGKRHSLVTYHLEQLAEWKLVEVVKNNRYGSKVKRSIWGLNLKYPNLIREIYTRILKIFFTQNDLEKMCNINRNARIHS